MPIQVDSEIRMVSQGEIQSLAERIVGIVFGMHKGFGNPVRTPYPLLGKPPSVPENTKRGRMIFGRMIRAAYHSAKHDSACRNWE